MIGFQGGRKVIKRQADLGQYVDAGQVLAQLDPQDCKLAADAARAQLRAAGTHRDLAAADLAGVPTMLVLTFTLLMLQVQSFSRAMLVFLTGPLGIAGVAGALLLLRRPFGFVALLGVSALMGMIQRNSVILIDQIEHERARGVAAWDAFVESAVRRARPVV